MIANRSLVALFESREEATMRATTGLGIRCLSGCNGCLGYGLLLGFFGVGAAIGAVVLQRARSKLSVEWVVSGATVVFGYGGFVYSAFSCLNHWRVLQVDWRARLVPRPSP